MRKRILALLLALVMCLSLLPTAAFAEDVTGDDDTTGGTVVTDTPTDEDKGEGEDKGEDTDTPDTPAAPTGDDEGEDAGDADDDTTDSPAAPVVQSAGTPMVGASSGGHSSHCICGKMATTHRSIGDHSGGFSRTWQEWTAISSLPTSQGYYYLTANVTITGTWEISSGKDIRLCLNGHTITMSGDGPVIKVTNGASITLTDCTSTHGKITHAVDKTGCGVYVDGTGTFNMYGGTITGNNDYANDNEPGGGVYVAASGKFNMYGGQIADNRGTYDFGSYTHGGGVYIATAASKAGGTFNMYGGTIGGTGEDDGNSAHYGAGVYMATAYADDPPATFEMSGGKIVGNNAGNDGGGVFVGGYGKFTMTGGSITGNRASSGQNNSAGGGVYVGTDSITVGGSAKITGNKSDGITNDGKDDNVYLTDAGVCVNVKNNFNGEVGINIITSLWGVSPSDKKPLNPDWVAVAGEGRKSAIESSKITYDNGALEIKSDGKLKCLHTGGLWPNETIGHCLICNEAVYFKTEFKNEAGTITTKTQYYATASAAFKDAEDNCVITLLTAAEFSSYTWALGGKTVTLNADYALDGLTVKNGTLNLNYTKGATGKYIQNMVVENGATVNVDVKNLKFYNDPSLTVKSGGKVVFKSGSVEYLKVESGGKMEIRDGTTEGSHKYESTFGSITVADGMTCNDLLANGYAYFDKTSEAIVSGSGTTLSNVTVKSHACNFQNKPTCDCGRECPHGNINFGDGKCSDCNAPMTGVLVQKTAGGAIGTQEFATFNEAVDSIQPSDTNVTIKLMTNATFEDTDPAMGDDNTTILFPCTIDLNGKKLTVKERYENNIVECNLTIASTVTITDTSTGTTAGTIESGVLVYADEEDNVVGKLTVTGNVSIPSLWVGNGAEATLTGGTYGKIDVLTTGKTCLDLLPDKYAYFDSDSNDTNLVNGNVTQLPTKEAGKYYVKPHPTCTYDHTTGVCVCGCGRECAHSNIDTTAHKCSDCQTLMVAKVTKGESDNDPSYYTTFNAALKGVEGAKNTDDATLTLLEDTNLSDNATLPRGVYTIELNGKTLGNSEGKDYVLTADSQGSATIKDSSTGKITCTLKCTVAGHSSLSITGGTFTKLEMAVVTSNGTGWPMLSGGTFGQIVRTGNNSNVNCRVVTLLAPGHALKKNDDTSGSDAYYSADTEIRATAIENVTVVECPCGSSASCNYCGKNLPVELTLYGAEGAVLSQTYYTTVGAAMETFDTAEEIQNLAAKRATIRLLSVTPDNINYTNSIPLTIDLNGQNLNGSIEVGTVDKPGSLTITGDGNVGADSNSKVTVTNGTLYVNGGNFTGGLEVGANGNAVLSGGTFSLPLTSGGMPAAEIKVAEGKTVGSLLKSGYGYKCTYEGNTYRWATTNELQRTELSHTGAGISAVTVKKLPSVSVSASPTSITYGSTATLTATVSGVEAGKDITYKWYKDGSESAITDATSVSYQTSNDLTVGDHTFICTAEVDGSTYTSESVTVTVNKATLTEQTGGSSGESGGEGGGTTPGGSESTATYTAPTAKTDLTYTGAAQELIDAGTVPTGCTMKYRLGESGDFTTTIPTATDAGEYTVYWYITGGTDYNDVGSTENPAGSVKVTIAPKNINSTGITAKATGGTYNGNWINATLTVTDGDKTLEKGRDHTVTGETSKINAGTYTLTITGNGNYTGTQNVEWTIDRKSVTLTPDTYTVYAMVNGSVTVELDKVAKALGMPADDGTLTFESSDTVDGTYTSCNSTYTQTGVTTATTKYFKALSTNHSATFTLNVEVSENAPTISVNDFTKTYDGKAVTVEDLTKSVTGTIEGAWSWTKDGTAPKDVADSGYYLVTFTPTGSGSDPVTTMVQVMIMPKDIGDNDITATAGNSTYTGQPIGHKLSVKHGETTLQGYKDYSLTGTTTATNAGTYTLTITGKGNYTGTRTMDWTIAPKTLTASGLTARKEYDGTTTVNANTTSSLTLSETLTLNTDYTITAVFDSADAGNRTVTATVKLLNTNYCFSIGADGTPVREKEITGNGYIAPRTLTTLPTVKADVVRIQQDVSVTGGSYLLPDNVELTLPEGFSPSRELRFALGDPPAKVKATIGEGGMLSYTISGGRSGEKFAIPVTVTLPNFVYSKDGGAAAVALFAQNDDSLPEIAPDDGTITLGFTVEIELTGGGHEHIRRQPIGTGTSGGGSTSGNGSASGSGSTGGNGVASPDTGDAGIALYGVLTVLSLTGGAWVSKRKMF